MTGYGLLNIYSFMFQSGIYLSNVFGELFREDGRHVDEHHDVTVLDVRRDVHPLRVANNVRHHRVHLLNSKPANDFGQALQTVSGNRSIKSCILINYRLWFPRS